MNRAFVVQTLTSIQNDYSEQQPAESWWNRPVSIQKPAIRTAKVEDKINPSLPAKKSRRRRSSTATT